MKDDVISRQAALDAVSKACLELRGIFARCEDALKDLPTVDAVPVVRCKDCEYYAETNGRIGTCELTISGAEDDGFCAWGERKKDDADT